MTTRDTPTLQVAAKAVIVNSTGQVLIVREASSDKNNTKVGYWGLVGGRLEPGESFLAALQREVKEETGLTIEAIRPLYVGEWRSVIHGRQHQIIAIFMLCRMTKGLVVMSVEHDEYAWIDPKDRARYVMMEPDCDVIDALGQ